MEEKCRGLADCKAKAVGDYVRCLLAAGVKFLLFAYHLRMLDELERTLREESSAYVRIDGSTPSEARAAAVAQFQNDMEVRVALLSLMACCQGVTLNAASLVVFAELYWVPGILLQAEDRAHRLGQTSSVNVQYLIARGTVDERMFRVAAQRALDNSATLDDCGPRWRYEMSMGVVVSPDIDVHNASESCDSQLLRADGGEAHSVVAESSDDAVALAIPPKHEFSHGLAAVELPAPAGLSEAAAAIGHNCPLHMKRQWSPASDGGRARDGSRQGRRNSEIVGDGGDDSDEVEIIASSKKIFRLDWGKRKPLGTRLD